jgi:hypothetical protein
LVERGAAPAEGVIRSEGEARPSKTDVVVSPLGGASKVRRGWCCWEVEFVDGSRRGAGGWETGPVAKNVPGVLGG